MNWDYVRGKKKQKENKNKQTKRKQTTSKILKAETLTHFHLLIVQICNGTAVEHGSLLNCSGVCDGINCCKSVIITK
jgi:hypothetical protein